MGGGREEAQALLETRDYILLLNILKITSTKLNLKYYKYCTKYLYNFIYRFFRGVFFTLWIREYISHSPKY